MYKQIQCVLKQRNGITDDVVRFTTSNQIGESHVFDVKFGSCDVA